MKVILKCTLDAGKGKQTPPRSVVDLDKNEAMRLIRMRLAEPFDVKKEVDSLIPAEGDDELEDVTPTLEEAIKDLIRIEGVDESLAAGLYNEEVYSVIDVAQMKSTKILTQFEGVNVKTAREIVKKAKALIGN